MTDIFAAEAAPATPMSEPAPVSTPALEPAQRTAFDDNLDDFLGRDLLSEMAPKPAESPPAQSGSEPAPAQAQPAVPGAAPAAAAGAPSSQPAPANGGVTPPATTSQPAPAGETATSSVNPELLMQMFGSEPTPVPAAAAPAQPSPTETAPASTEDEVPMPFTTQMQLPPQMVSALFESEDPVQRTQALTGLMAALGNAVVGYVEQRMTTHHAPRLANQFEAAQTARTQAAAVNAHFYGAYPELAQYKQIVERAGNVYMKANPNATYSEETAKGIADLAKGALTQMGKTLTPPANGAPAPAAPATTAPPRPVATPYVAGGASPGGALETPMDPNDPGSVFDQMVGGWG